MSHAVISVRELMNAGEAELTTGPFGTQLKAAEYVADGIPVINVRNIGFGDIRSDAALEYVAADTAQRLSRHVLRYGDIVFGRKGAVERHAYIAQHSEGWLQGSDCLRLRLTSTRVLPRFASYCLLTDRHKTWMQNQCSHGATMASLNQDIISRIELPVPPIQHQRNVVAVLSAYDELIENSRRRIRLLEEMAQRIYREWLVDFRYPGHADVPLVGSELGPIPEGWRVCRLAEICRLMRAGGTPSRAKPEYWDDGTVDWYKTNELRDGWLFGSGEKVTQLALAEGKTRLYPAGTVLMAIYGSPTVGRFGLLTSPATCNQAALAMQTDEAIVPQTLLPFLLKQLRDHFNSIAQGAAQQNISKEKAAETKIVVPDFRVAREAADHVEPLMQTTRALSESVRKLQSARDLLLPRFVAGDINVDNLDISVEEAVA